VHLLGNVGVRDHGGALAAGNQPWRDAHEADLLLRGWRRGPVGSTPTPRISGRHLERLPEVLALKAPLDRQPVSGTSPVPPQVGQPPTHSGRPRHQGHSTVGSSCMELSSPCQPPATRPRAGALLQTCQT
jgi:hypothetical protein